MADSSNFCLCGDASVGPTKSTANSFTFAGCDGGQPVQISASNIADYIISVIYGDSEGVPPAEGCYNVCYDGAGNRSISLVSQQELTSYELLEAVTIFPTGGGVDDREAWGRAQTRVIALSPPPAGYTPTHVRLRIWGYMGGDGETNILRDVNGNRIFFMRSYNDDDDHSSINDVLVPVQPDGVGGYEVFITGDFSNGGLNIKQVGYDKLCTFDDLGNVTDPVVDTPVDETAAPSDTTPLKITHLKHTYNAGGQDQTVVEWNIDPLLASGIDTYDIYFDFGGNEIHTETVTHVIAGSFTKQRLVINWNTLNCLRLESVVTEGVNSGDVVTSDFGVTDPTIPTGTNETTVVV